LNLTTQNITGKTSVFHILGPLEPSTWDVGKQIQNASCINIPEQSNINTSYQTQNVNSIHQLLSNITMKNVQKITFCKPHKLNDKQLH